MEEQDEGFFVSHTSDMIQVFPIEYKKALLALKEKDSSF